MPDGSDPPLPTPPGTGAIAERAHPYDSGAPPVREYSVGQIAAYLRELLDTDPVVANVWIAGEVTSLSRSQAGHLYFTLIDEAGALRCVFFRGDNLGVTVEQGTQVIAHGRVSFYLERGDLQFYVDALQPEGIGVLQAEFQRLLARLEGEGLFEPSRKRPLPRYPRAIGVATSPAGAVWHDIQTVLARRWPLTELVLAPCRVQGKGAAPTIVRAIERLNRPAAAGEAALDLIIVARGGGSIEDLWPFNDEGVARAIFASGVPVVSAVGHETDYTIADYVADARAPTPSAAAEIVAPETGAERDRVVTARVALARGLESAVERARHQVDGLAARLDKQEPDITPLRLRLDELGRGAGERLASEISTRRAGLGALVGRLGALDSGATLARGYAIVLDERRRPVTRAATLERGDRLRIRFQDGTASAAVTAIETGQ